MKINSSKTAFTLIELLIGIVAVSILILAVIAILVGPIRALKRNSEYSQIRRDISYAAAVISRQVRTAQFSTIPENSLELILPANGVRTHTSTFSRSDGALVYDNGSQKTDLIVEGCTVFTNGLVQALDASGVIIYLEVTNPDGSIVVTHESFIHTRS